MLSRFIAVILAVALSLVTVNSSVAGVDEVYIKPTGKLSWSDTFKRLYNRDEFGKSYALIIGIGDYHPYPRLSAPIHDAMRVRNFLRDEANFDHIITLTDEKATRSRIESLMDYELPDLIRPRDRFLFYFSGHGDTRTFGDREKRGYLVLKSSGSKAWHEMIDMPRMRHWAQNLGHVRHALILLDACFSGLAALEPKSGTQDMTLARLTQPGHHIVTAGTEGEESYAVDGQSLFTSAFLSAARGGGDSTGDGIVSLSEMLTHINVVLDGRRAELGDRIRMSPQRWYTRTENNPGEFFFIGQSGLRMPSSSSTSAPSYDPPSEVQRKRDGITEPSQAAKEAFERGNNSQAWAGIWMTTWGELIIDQNASRVVGTYRYYHKEARKHIAGRIDGNLGSDGQVRGRWREATEEDKKFRGDGDFSWRLEPGGERFAGKWSQEIDGPMDDDWNGERKK